MVMAALVVGWYGYWAWRENVRTGTTVRERLAKDEVSCVACRTSVKAVQAREGTCGGRSCLAAVCRGRARMDEARAQGGDRVCELTVAEVETRGSGEVPVRWSAVWKVNGS